MRTYPGSLAVMKYLHVPVTTSENVMSDTKHNTIATYTYIENMVDVVSSLYKQGAYGHMLGSESALILACVPLFRVICDC